MKTKLLFSAIQKLKNGIKRYGIFTFLIIFFMTISSFGQSGGFTFDCLNGGGSSVATITFSGPSGGDINGYPYWTGGVDNVSTDEYLLLVQEVEIPDENGIPTGIFVDRWEVHKAIPGVNFPTVFNFGELYFYSNVIADTLVCDNPDSTWGIEVGCASVSVECLEDADIDDDGVPNDDDNCLDTANADQADADMDGIGDVCDICPGFDDTADADGDTIPDDCDICSGFDDTADSDGDLIPDGCEADSDNDGVIDDNDVCPGFDDTADADGDLIPDGCEADSDNDGIIDDNDVCSGFDDTADADGDTIPDGCDNCPNDANADQTDADADGIGDVCDEDGPSNNDYVIIALEEIHLHDTNTVEGNIGATEDDGKVKLHDMTTVSGSVEASDIDIDNDSSVGSIILQPAVVDLPPFVFNSVSKNSDLDVTVEPDETVTLHGQVYGKIKVKEGGTVIFTNSNVYLEELKTYDNGIVDFTGCTNLFINKKVKLEDNTSFNPNGKSVTLYVDDKVDVEEGSDVKAYIYANKYIDVKAQDDNRTNMTGFFSGKKVKGQKNVSWAGQTGYAPCDIVEPEITEEADCDCKGGIVSLTFTYSGEFAMLLDTNSGYITENLDGTYTVFDDGEKLKKNLEISDGDLDMVDDIGSSFATIHTSCSQEILGVTYDEVFTVISHTDTDGNICESNVSARAANSTENVVKSFSGFEIRVWPNPSENNFNVRVTTLDDLNKIDIQVIDITGKRIHNDTINWDDDYEFGDRLQSGMYFVKITQASATEVIKVIKR